MPSISFSWTTAPLLAGAKTCTRRNWADAYARRFHLSSRITAYDRRPDYGGIKLATIELIGPPYLEWTGDMPSADYEAEGLKWLEAHPEHRGAFFENHDMEVFWRAWKTDNELLWVVRFEVVEQFLTLEEWTEQRRHKRTKDDQLTLL